MSERQVVITTNKPEYPLFGKTVAIIGGGPAGAFAANLLAKAGISVDIFEPRSPRLPIEGEKRLPCTGCAGLLQKETIDLLAKYGLRLPEEVIQTRIKEASVNLPKRKIPLNMTTQAVTVFRGWAPIRLEENSSPVNSFDAWLLNKAINAGARHHEVDILSIDLKEDNQGKVHLTDNKKGAHEADMIIGAFGHKPSLMESIIYPSDETAPLEKPTTQIALVREYYFGSEVEARLGAKIHYFGNPTDSIWFAALIPKKEYITVVLMGRNDTKPKDYDGFFDNPQVVNLLGNMKSRRLNCGCQNPITVKSPKNFMIAGKNNKIVYVGIGDTGATRPRKNGIFAALDSAEYLAAILLRSGNVSRTLTAFQKYIEQTYVWDNFWAEVVLRASDLVLNHKLPRETVVYLAEHHLPILTPAILTTIDHVITGKSPYWRIPIDALEKAVRS